ncbi:Protein CBG26922 [Caenorhabditis briggsae]|uniref:Protein CBG26922 n=1 Tax=Caenorhabditis briggsae TaxID=6238 RepID=B6IKW9_CAEBR|nr:Protein CBG26922 [Caenorhabditis briggsae]CAS00549.1 Protein CBG26922 [Caenorhabditis briggsae]
MENKQELTLRKTHSKSHMHCYD